jgi:hypothetical protein
MRPLKIYADRMLDFLNQALKPCSSLEMGTKLGYQVHESAMAHHTEWRR